MRGEREERIKKQKKEKREQKETANEERRRFLPKTKLKQKKKK